MKMLVLARIAASRFVVRRGKVESRRSAWLPIVLHWRRTRRRIEVTRDRKTAAPSSTTSVWRPQFHLHFTTALRRESFSPRVFLRGEKVPKADEGGVHPSAAIDRQAQMTYACVAPSSAYRHLLPRQKPRGRRALDVTGRVSIHAVSEKSGQTRPSVVSPAAYRARGSVVETQRKGIRPSTSKNERPHLFQTHTPIGRRELQVSRRPAPLADTRRAPASTTSQQVIVRSPEIVYRRELRPRTEIAGQPLHPSPAPSPARSVVRQETASEVSAKRPAALRVTDLDPALLDRLTDDVIRRVEKRVRIERERRGL